MMRSLEEIIDSYDPNVPLDQATTIPSSWYVDERIHALELETVFARSWQFAARADQLERPGAYVTLEIGREPIVVVRGRDNLLRGFFNVCGHHAAALMTDPEGTAPHLRCPYHGWTYSLEGELKGTPDFTGVCNFERAGNGLVPVEVSIWEKWVFVRVGGGTGILPVSSAQTVPISEHAQDARATEDFPSAELSNQISLLDLGQMQWLERRHYRFDCNWKVFVDNYLDGGYHVPQLHKGLNSVLDCGKYKVETGEDFCLQSSPIVTDGAEPEIGEVRRGNRALYYWLYPNFMINWYQGSMDTNLVIPHGVDKTEVIFDFYFADVSEAARRRNHASIEVGQRIQREDEDICRSVQRGLNSRAYNAGRLSVRREAGEHLFHRSLFADLKLGVGCGIGS